VGSPGQKWHGVDKVIYLASKFLKNTFHIIGPEKDEIIRLGLKISNNVIFHGYLNQRELENIVSRCDIGVSSLAVHRKNMNEASSLKSRQYLAQGLPIIIGYQDTDLSEELDFVLNIGNYEDNVKDNIKEIETFSEEIKKMNPEHIISQSRTYLNYEIKESKRLMFFKNILSIN